MSVSQFTLYQSSDTSAPVISGSTGTLVAALDAILVNGYGSKTAAGWTITFTATGKRNYKMASGTGFQMYIDDTGPGAGTFKEARITGFESTSALGTGSGQFPTSSQGVASPGFQVARKSATADSVARPWFCFADGRTFYFGIQTSDNAGYYYCFCFGDVYSLAGGSDTWNCMIMGRTVENSTSAAGEAMGSSIASPLASGTGQYIARTYGGGGASIAFGKAGDYVKGGGFLFGNSTVSTVLPTPNGADNAYYVSPIWIFETPTGVVRGRWRGVWQVCHAATNFSDGQTFSGANDVAGKSFMVRNFFSSTSGGGGCLAFETSNTVETN